MGFMSEGDRFAGPSENRSITNWAVGEQAGCCCAVGFGFGDAGDAAGVGVVGASAVGAEVGRSAESGASSEPPRDRDHASAGGTKCVGVAGSSSQGVET